MTESRRIYARNLLANWLGHGANMVVLLFLSPFVVHTLGKVEYGIWSLLTVLTGYMGILDLGIRASTGRYVILYLGRGDHQKVDETIRTGLGFFAGVGVLIQVAAALIGWVFPIAFADVPLQYHGTVRLLLPLLAVNVWMSAFASVVGSIMPAHDRFDLRCGLDLTVLTFRTAGTVYALMMGYGLVGLSLVVVACNVLALLGSWYLSHRIYPGLKVWPLKYSRDRLRELFTYGFYALIGTISIKIIGQTDLIVTGWLIGIREVTVYSVGAMLIYYSSTIIEQINQTLFPPVQRAVARGEMGPARWLFFRQVRLSMILGLPMNVGFIVFGTAFIRLWMLKAEFTQADVLKAGMVMAILAGSKLLILFNSGSETLLAALGYIRFSAIVSVLHAMLNLGLSLFFVMVLKWGLAGVAAGTLVGRLIGGTFILPWYACRKVNLNWWRYLADIGGRECASILAFGAACIAIHWTMPCTSWMLFWVQVALALVCYLPVAWVALVPKDDKKRLLGWLRKRRLAPSVQDPNA
jgi:O-antigen/teichoic acid export membrane protein